MASQSLSDSCSQWHNQVLLSGNMQIGLTVGNVSINCKLKLFFLNLKAFLFQIKFLIVNVLFAFHMLL